MGILFPPRCISCGKVLSFDKRYESFCQECKREVSLITPPVCKKCGKKLRIPLTSVCGDCQKTNHFYTQGKALFLYAGPMKLAMYKLKYSNHRFMVKYFAKAAKRRYGDWIKEIGVEAILAVPMYEKKKKKRGYNQAELFGEALSKELGIHFYKDFVIRQKNTTPQKGLNFSKRNENLKNAFKLYRNIVKLNCILIVDDIYTTGATIDSVAKTLVASGVKKIYFLTICIGSDI
ncbi:MAG: ComF family protein [Lachnospiraceae bacterium]|nr:ComF family protein [Lachnospiraceae bacterium]